MNVIPCSQERVPAQHGGLAAILRSGCTTPEALPPVSVRDTASSQRRKSSAGHNRSALTPDANRGLPLHQDRLNAIGLAEGGQRRPVLQYVLDHGQNSRLVGVEHPGIHAVLDSVFTASRPDWRDGRCSAPCAKAAGNSTIAHRRAPACARAASGGELAGVRVVVRVTFEQTGEIGHRLVLTDSWCRGRRRAGSRSRRRSPAAAPARLPASAPNRWPLDRNGFGSCPAGAWAEREGRPWRRNLFL